MKHTEGMHNRKMSQKKWEEGANREERAAAHGKHMSSVSLYRDAYTDGEKGVDGSGLERKGWWEGCEAGTG